MFGSAPAPSFKRKKVAGRDRVIAVCPTCHKEFPEDTKPLAKSKYTSHDSSSHKPGRKQKARADKAKAADELKTRANQAREEKDKREAKEAEKQAQKERDAAPAKGRRGAKAEAKGKCPHCKKSPCKGTKPGCAKRKAASKEYDKIQYDKWGSRIWD